MQNEESRFVELPEPLRRFRTVSGKAPPSGHCTPQQCTSGLVEVCNDSVVVCGCLAKHLVLSLLKQHSKAATINMFVDSALPIYPSPSLSLSLPPPSLSLSPQSPSQGPGTGRRLRDSRGRSSSTVDLSSGK